MDCLVADAGKRDWDKLTTKYGAMPTDNQLPASCTVSWVLNADGYWGLGSNWSGDVVPGPMDDVCLDVATNVTITHRQGTLTVNSVRSEEGLILSGGVLTSPSLQISR